eukprot:CAMPEP_0185764262 /NCGR_PEP_ID=MMETSP1174-20130828/23201_1 /TAXON_ID=35687 /ORGANISM="Dictyocha speculum, Strain CCMP1381" /LENGTH=196 /DNA_ID=CAMNT_0028446725 /DNA_START=147 /DNA_END=737 /DNA_ORIENTATION=-
MENLTYMQEEGSHDDHEQLMVPGTQTVPTLPQRLGHFPLPLEGLAHGLMPIFLHLPVSLLVLRPTVRDGVTPATSAKLAGVTLHHWTARERAGEEGVGDSVGSRVCLKLTVSIILRGGDCLPLGIVTLEEGVRRRGHVTSALPQHSLELLRMGLNTVKQVPREVMAAHAHVGCRDKKRRPAAATTCMEPVLLCSEV